MEPVAPYGLVCGRGDFPRALRRSLRNLRDPEGSGPSRIRTGDCGFRAWKRELGGLLPPFYAGAGRLEEALAKVDEV
jgi:hypothetical protein